jgi:hypothetical protein
MAIPMIEANNSTLAGGCQCGAVRYRLLATPARASVCHCRMCQKASGGPLMAFARVRKTELKWTRGSQAVFQSSNLVERGFCNKCGTPLTYNFVAGPNISVTIASLDDPEAVRPDMQHGIEGELSWLASVRSLPSQRTEDYFAPEVAARFVGHQHPDRDT